LEHESRLEQESKVMKSLLEHLQERQRERFCKDGCDPCPFCDGKTPHFCPIDGHMTETAKQYSKEYVD